MKISSQRILLITTLALLISSCNFEEKKHEKDVPAIIEAPEQIVSIENAKEMFDNYTKRRVSLIEDFEESLEDGSKFVASRFGDYDLETIKQYIAYVEQEAKEANVEVSTLRFYFSNYPNKEEFPDKRKVKHPRQNSFFILPTLKEGKDNFGFYISVDAKGNKVAKLIKDKYSNSTTPAEQIKSEASLMPSISLFRPKPMLYPNTESLIMNEVTMGPPPNDSDFN